MIIPWFRCEFSDSQHVDLKMYCTVFFVHTLLHAHAGRCTRRSFFRGRTFTYIGVFFFAGIHQCLIVEDLSLGKLLWGGRSALMFGPWLAFGSRLVEFL